MPDFLGQATVAADGTAEVIVRHNKNGLFWIVEQISVLTSKVASATTAFILLNGNVVAPSSALTPLGTLGQATTAGGDPYVYIAASDSISVRVQGAITGDSMTVRAQYRELLDTDPEVRGRYNTGV